MVMRWYMILCTFLLVACEQTTPTEAYLDREGSARRSDTLVNILDGMIARIVDLPRTGDRDVDLARELIEHHRATIALNDHFLAHGNEVPGPLRVFAERLTAQKQREVEEMQAFIRSHPPVPPGGQRGQPDLLEGLAEVPRTDDLPQAYRHLMHLQLQDGLTLARKWHERGLHDEVKEMLATMVKNMEANIQELETLNS